MASGCIVGECAVCGWLVYEDEFDMIGDLIIHEQCQGKHLSKKIRIQKLKKLIEEMEQEEEE